MEDLHLDTVEGREFLKRSPDELMKPERLGSFRIHPLSFSRSLLRRIHQKQWSIQLWDAQIGTDGAGELIYRINAEGQLFHFVLFSQDLKEEERNDRVISEKWDMTFVLCEGDISKPRLQQLRENIPKQEAGRVSTKDLVMSRANRSTRVFDNVVDALSKGNQPDPELLKMTGYLVRSTAFYGNGKFGLAPFKRLKGNHPFAGAFRAQMFAAYMLREASFEVVNRMAAARSSRAVFLHQKWKRFLGIGNATGLGMVPFLLTHPKLIHRWISLREEGIAMVKQKRPGQEKMEELAQWLAQGRKYFQEYPISGKDVFTTADKLVQDLGTIQYYLGSFKKETFSSASTWFDFTMEVLPHISIEGEEILNNFLMELYPKIIYPLENRTAAEETYEFEPKMTMKTLLNVIETNYNWVFDFDFNQPDTAYYFWYRSKEKEEPRLGVREEEDGVEKEMRFDYARQIQHLYELVKSHKEHITYVSNFILTHPEQKTLVKRIQSLRYYPYGEIQGNLLGKNLIPLHLMRCKLSFFGAERFSPKSNQWVRVTLFQGAPLIEDPASNYTDTWIFPTAPTEEELNDGFDI